MMKKAIFAVLLLLATTGRAGAQVDSCLAYYDTVFNSTHSRGGLINTDSALVDTCSGSSTYRGIYVKQWFNFAFRYGSMLQLPSAPADTILEVSWTAIDTNYAATRSAFQALETKYGTFVLRKLNPDLTDTNKPLQGGAYKIRFLNYVCEDSAWHDLKAVPEIDDTFMQDGLLVPYASVVVTYSFEKNGIQIYPNPARSSIDILGRSDSPLFLYDEKGECLKVLNPSQETISLEGLPFGNYFLRSNNNFARFVKEP
jgi:hypothetical protein